MALVEFAERELRAAGLFDEDADYGGVGPEVMELIKTFAGQGHSGMSARYVLEIFNRVALFRPLSPLRNPMKSGEYMVIHEEFREDGMEKIQTLQSTRRSSLFSNDGGKTWHDIDLRVPWWKRIFGVRLHVWRKWAPEPPAPGGPPNG